MLAINQKYAVANSGLEDNTVSHTKKATSKEIFIMCSRFPVSFYFLTAAALLIPLVGRGDERTQHFDRDPGWEGHNNRPLTSASRTIKQDFGYSKTAHAGGGAGEIGGLIAPAAEPAYYAKEIPQKSFADSLTASGKLVCTGRRSHFLITFFNKDTLNEWRTPNTIALRISARGDVFYAWVEYATGRWRAGGDSPQSFPMIRNPQTGKAQFKGFPANGKPCTWSLEYQPEGNNGSGSIVARIEGETAVCHLAPGHKAEGAVFNRFGVLTVMKHADDAGVAWLDDVTVNGQKDEFATDPAWEELNNRTTYQTTDIRPKFDFGYSPTNHAGGVGKGELGGLIFRGDCRYPERMAYYADRLDELSLDKPLSASGKVSMRRGVTDSTVLVGFFHAQASMNSNSAQDSGLPRNLLGVAIEGPSREGFFFAPVYRTAAGQAGHVKSARPPYIYPDGAQHDWSLAYHPGLGPVGRIVVRMDKQAVELNLGADHRKAATQFNRFGIVTTWVDGNGQKVYFDDLRYTFRQE